MEVGFLGLVVCEGFLVILEVGEIEFLEEVGLFGEGVGDKSSELGVEIQLVVVAEESCLTKVGRGVLAHPNDIFKFN